MPVLMLNPSQHTTDRAALERALRLLRNALQADSSALVRLRQFEPQVVECFVSTPLSVIAAVRFPGVLDGDGQPVADAARVADILAAAVPDGGGATASADGAEHGDMGMSMEFRWLGALPPAEGFQLVDTVPLEQLRVLLGQLEQENAATPQGVARSLLEQTLIEVSRAQPPLTVPIQGRVVAALNALRMIPPAKALRPELDVVRVSATANWVRLDTVVASAYYPRPGGLARVP